MPASPASLWRLLVVASAALLGPTAQAQTVDPALAAPWAFVQHQMPGLPYDVLKGACAEGQLMIYHGTWADAQQAQVAAFRKRFPCISVKLFQLNATPLRSRFQSESQAGLRIVDIVQDTDPGTLNDEAAAGLFMQYVITNDAQYADAVKKKGYWYPLRIALEGIAWNTDLVSDADAKSLMDWKDVADPKWAGRAGVADPASGGVNYLPWYAWDKLYGDDFIRKIGALHPRVYNASNPAAAALASGDIAVTVATETGITPLYEKGAPIRWAFPEPALGIVTGQAIPANAPHPNAAKLYQEYSFTLEGYTIWQKTGGAPARLGYKDQRAVAAEAWYKYPTKFFAYDPNDFTQHAQEVKAIAAKYVGSSH